MTCNNKCYTQIYYGCCRLFQTTIKNCKVPHLKSTNLNSFQVTTITCCNKQVKQHYCTMLATATGNCDVTNVSYDENKYYVVTWTVYLESSMYLRPVLFLRCFEGPKWPLKFVQRSLKIYWPEITSMENGLSSFSKRSLKISLRSPKRNLKKNLYACINQNLQKYQANIVSA